MRLPRGGFVVHYVALSICLVVATAIAVAAVIIQASGQLIERDADRRLVDGATLVQASLDEDQEELAAVGSWLQQDPAFVDAVRENESSALGERLAVALELHVADELSVANPRGEVLARVGSDRVLRRGSSMAGQVGFQQAIAGAASAGFAYRGGDFLRHELYLPIRPSAGDTAIGVLCLSDLLDQEDLDRFRRRTGVDVSLFFGETTGATALRAASGLPLTQGIAAPEILREILDYGRDVSVWRELPSGRVRAHFVPLNGPSGTPVGMFSTSMPVDTIAVGLREVLAPSLPVILAIILGGAALTYFLAHRLHQPVLVLAGAAARIREGDFLTPIPTIREPELVPLAEELERARSRVHATLQTIADAEERQRALFAALHDPVLTTSAEGRITGFNAAAMDLLGGPVRLYGQHVREVLPFVDTSAGTDGAAGWQGRIEAAEGVTTEVEVSRTQLAGGTFPPMDIYLLHDVTQHVELSRMREQLLYSVAHEVRGPLSTLDNILDIIAQENAELTPGELSGLARSARSTAARLYNVLEALLSAGAIQSGRFEVQPEPSWLSMIVDDAIQTAAPLTEARGQRIEQQVPTDDVRVLADPRYVRQLFWNLFSNASKYSSDGDVIQLRAETVGDHVRVTVEDHGRGIPPEQQDGLFQRFYRAQSGRDMQGIGLGLAIAKAVVEAHGGAIGVESAVGIGTCVWFTLPRVHDSADSGS